MLKIDIITIFPGMFEKVFDHGKISKASQENLFDIKVHNLRDFTEDRHKQVDDYPFGGGPGMIFKIEPIYNVLNTLCQSIPDEKEREKIIFLSPSGQRYDYKLSRELSVYEHIILMCGRYEGYDVRIREFFPINEISIGDYILTGGEIPAMVIIDSVVRLLPGFLKDEVVQSESFFSGRLDFPQYTRPRTFRGLSVPEVLISGNHGEIEKWRREQAKNITEQRRPDLIKEEGEQ